MLLTTSIQALHPLQPAEIELFRQRCRVTTYARKEFLLQAGQTCKGVYFIESGLVGVHQLKEGKALYQEFFFAGDFATAIVSLSQQQPSEQYLVALQPTQVLYCSRETLFALYAECPPFQAFGRALLERLLVDKTNLVSLQTTLSAKEKYRYVLEKHPRWLQEVPLQHLCSYLGMARETLSRMRKEK